MPSEVNSYSPHYIFKRRDHRNTDMIEIKQLLFVVAYLAVTEFSFLFFAGGLMESHYINWSLLLQDRLGKLQNELVPAFLNPSDLR